MPSAEGDRRGCHVTAARPGICPVFSPRPIHQPLPQEVFDGAQQRKKAGLREAFGIPAAGARLSRGEWRTRGDAEWGVRRDPSFDPWQHAFARSEPSSPCRLFPCRPCAGQAAGRGRRRWRAPWERIRHRSWRERAEPVGEGAGQLVPPGHRRSWRTRGGRARQDGRAAAAADGDRPRDPAPQGCRFPPAAIDCGSAGKPCARGRPCGAAADGCRTDGTAGGLHPARRTR